MNSPYDPAENLKERLRRVLADNPEPPQVWSPFTEDGPVGEAPAEGATAAEIGAAAEASLEPYEPAATGTASREAAAEATIEAAGEAESEPTAEPAGEPVTVELHHGIPGPDDYVRLINQRLHAIRVIQDMEPKQLCAGRRVRELSQALAATPGDSIHYRVMLHRLREVHEEWLCLEEQIAAANHIIRSTQWLVELLAEPPRRGGGA